MLQKSRREIESHLYVRRIKIPILHIIGKLDGIFEFEDSFIPWNELIGTNEKDKTIITLENVGHALPKDLQIKNHLKFLKKYNWFNKLLKRILGISEILDFYPYSRIPRQHWPANNRLNLEG